MSVAIEQRIETALLKMETDLLEDLYHKAREIQNEDGNVQDVINLIYQQWKATIEETLYIATGCKIPVVIIIDDHELDQITLMEVMKK